MLQKVLDTALFFNVFGAAVFPAKPRDKRPALDAWKKLQQILPNTEQLMAWFGPETPDYNAAVVVGWRNLTVVDFDDQAQYQMWRTWAAAKPAARNVARYAYQVTSSRGAHLYVRTAAPEQNRKLKGIDIKATGGYVLGEGSVHPSGAIYTHRSASRAIPLVNALSDILPAELLLSHTELAPHVTLPARPVVAGAYDPWAAASGAQPNANLVARVKRALTLQDMLGDLQATSRDGRWFVTRCPLHDDHTPSFWVDTKRQICGCYSGCTPKPLDPINLFARLYGISNTDAIIEIARRLL